MNKKVATGLLATGTVIFAGIVLAVVTATTETRYAAPNGLSTGQCDTPAIACTIARAASLTGPGDTIVLTGTFTATKVGITLVGTSAQPITVQGPAVLDSSGAVMGDTDATLKCNGCQWVTFKNFTIQNSGARGLSFSGNDPTKSHHITVDGLTVLHVGQRAIGGSGDDVVIQNVFVEHAAEDNLTNGSTGGWAAAISSYTFGDGSPSHRWSLINSHVAYVRGECVIALRVDGWTATGNTIGNCYNIYTDKATNVLWANNTITQTDGWGKYYGRGDGFKLANEGSVNPLQLKNITFSGNTQIGVKDCFSYWQSAGTYSNVAIQDNLCQNNTGAALRFDAVPASQVQPTGNIYKNNTCSICSTSFGDTTDRAGWVIELATPVPTSTSTPTPTRTATWTASPSPSASPSSSPSPSPSDTPSSTPSATDTASATVTETSTQTPSPTRTPTVTPTASSTPFAALNNYGVQMTWNAANINASTQLGVGLVRVTVFIDKWAATHLCNECDALIAKGYKLIPTIRANGGAGVATVFPPDIAAYTLGLRSFLAQYRQRIEMVVIENEPNSSLFWGSPLTEYSELLIIACTESHAVGLQCTDGGAVSKLIALMTWAAYDDAGLDAAACSFANRYYFAEDPATATMLCTHTLSDFAIGQIAKGHEYLSVLQDAPTDLINMHLYTGDYETAREMMSQWRYAAGSTRPLMSNEVGNRLDVPDWWVWQLQAGKDFGLGYFVAFSVDTQGGARSLFNADGTLRPTGNTFKAWVAGQ